MRRPFTCEHPEERTELRQRLVGGGSVMVGHQCKNCGGLVGKWVKLERVPKWRELPQWDHGIESLWRESEKKYMHEFRAWRVQQDGIAAFGRGEEDKPDAFWEKYNEYLRTPQWAEKRALVLKRANGICEGCGVNAATQVHHLTYAHVGREMLFELVAICDACHEVVHGRTL